MKAILALVLSLAACATTRPRQDEATVPSPLHAPWSAGRVSPSEVLPVYTDVWRKAENRAQCSLLATVNPTTGGATAVARPATFSGGWAVAYDLPQQRSAFGVAGTGTSAWSPDVYDQWPHRITWSDGSTAGYGLEGGTGTNWLAYVKIPGQQCLYNVWSRLGRSHLEELLGTLRFIATT